MVPRSAGCGATAHQAPGFSDLICCGSAQGRPLVPGATGRRRPFPQGTLMGSLDTKKHRPANILRRRATLYSTFDMRQNSTHRIRGQSSLSDSRVQNQGSYSPWCERRWPQSLQGETRESEKLALGQLFFFSFFFSSTSLAWYPQPNRVIARDRTAAVPPGQNNSTAVSSSFQCLLC